MEHIGERIRRNRKEAGLSQEALAHRLKTKGNTVARWERGERTPTGLYLAAVERWLGMRVTWKQKTSRPDIADDRETMAVDDVVATLQAVAIVLRDNLDGWTDGNRERVEEALIDVVKAFDARSRE